MRRRIIVGISGASGAVYGVRLLERLRGLDVETHLIVSEGGERTLAVETGIGVAELRTRCDIWHRNDNLAASIASGSFLTHGMIIAPCSIRTLSGIANCYAENLMLRAADVTLKERRRLVLMVREAPLHKGHLELMLRASDYGAVILPPAPSFYHGERSIDDLVEQIVARGLDALGIEHDCAPRWGNPPQHPA
ncbi:MAG: UbiX family flavin prenyltransferase [Pseudomonadales bacterium]|nr:UbiX family flavin prenyltransferase [Pseudomonadales bacterium]MCP5319762.1 UbiX family flavin prenyltransferase [Pseudomonadales bacterium]MCP5338484.1 UbiX family flavin prenyltransferase [Pseudomonadales bacterium]